MRQNAFFRQSPSDRDRMRQFGRMIAITVLAVSVLPGCASWSKVSPLAKLEKSLVYQPSPFPADIPVDKIPFEDVQFFSGDGTRLHGWFADHPDPVGVALVCHGNAGNIASRGSSLQILNDRHRLAVMIFDYRGYGNSEGTPTESGVLSDARAARAWLAKRKQIPESEIILMGRSLGGGVAVDLAAKDGAKGLVLASTFTSMPAVAKNLLPAVPANLLMRQRFNSIDKLPNYQGPLLQSHGDADKLIPIEQGKQLFASARGPKRFVVIPNAGHNDPQSEEYRQALDQFLAEIGYDEH